jgi:hypothetical protein
LPIPFVKVKLRKAKMIKCTQAAFSVAKPFGEALSFIPFSNLILLDKTPSTDSFQVVGPYPTACLLHRGVLLLINHSLLSFYSLWFFGVWFCHTWGSRIILDTIPKDQEMLGIPQYVDNILLLCTWIN